MDESELLTLRQKRIICCNSSSVSQLTSAIGGGKGDTGIKGSTGVDGPTGPSGATQQSSHAQRFGNHAVARRASFRAG